MIHSSYIELNKKALAKNIKYIKRRIGKSVKLVSVIKGNAYGHGIKTYLPLAEECGIDYFAVSDTYEAELAFQAKKTKSTLLIMGMVDNRDLSWVIKNAISFLVFDLDRLKSSAKYARKLNKRAIIHIELETGLHRTGFDNDKLEQAIQLINNNKELFNIEGICTHYAGAESISNYVRVHNQYDKFKKLVQYLETKDIKARYLHTASSAATLVYPETMMDMVRIGIVQYGYWPSKEVMMNNLLSDEVKFTRNPLHQVLQWKSRIMCVKNVIPGEFISYGISFLVTKNTKIAVIPVGYHHGYTRILSNSGYVLIKGRKCPVIGMVNMNMFIVNVTNLPEVNKGDEVVLIGKQGRNKISVASFAELTNYVNYELLSRLPKDIPRIVVE